MGFFEFGQGFGLFFGAFVFERVVVFVLCFGDGFGEFELVLEGDDVFAHGDAEFFEGRVLAVFCFGQRDGDGFEVFAGGGAGVGGDGEQFVGAFYVAGGGDEFLIRRAEFVVGDAGGERHFADHALDGFDLVVAGA